MNSKKVVVAMSGGVDSSVAALMLNKKGFDVSGVFLRFWHDDTFCDSENTCCSSESLKRAQLVAKKLNISFYVIDCREEFKKYVVDYFILEYKKGNTPNPCVECNKRIKFGFLLNKIEAVGGDFLASGHYIRKGKLEYRLFRGKDENKDQSYFLYNLNQKKLDKLLFPIGDYSKEKVRKIAKDYKLPVFKTEESQDVCFLPKEGLELFLKKYIKNIKPGKIKNTMGEKVGEHKGLLFYTIGQRKGIKIGGGDPYYVVDKNIERNELIVTRDKEDKFFFRKKIKINNVNWINDNVLHFPMKVLCQTRYRQKPVKVLVLKHDEVNKSCTVEFINLQKAITSGQSAVFYKGNELLGGGVIK